VEVLTTFGYCVLSADGAAEALLLCEKPDRRIDLLLTDVAMPLLSGPELAAKLRQTRPELKVLYMSGHAGDAVSAQVMSDKDTGFIEKPFGPKQLSEVVRATLSNGPAQ